MNKWEKALAYKRKRPFDHLGVCREQEEREIVKYTEREKAQQKIGRACEWDIWVYLGIWVCECFITLLYSPLLN
jgi:hypothetical protein